MPTRQTEPADAGTTPIGSAAERRHFAASKLAAPPLRSGIVDRPVLVDKLISVPDVPVVLVSAPAGYGKTTLLTLWQQRDG
jgi:ATP/maltotriose-dependent transcriptional regulator MalT